jgi:parallel beta-helix repeat protein
MNPFRIAAAYLLIAILGSVNAATISVDPGGSIQSAIYAARAGDVIEVHSGVYYEHVNVNKRVILRGIGMPVLDATASGDAITLSADGIVLQGFRTINSGLWPGNGSGEAGIEVLSNNNIVEGNNASNNSNGIFIIGCHNNTVAGNTASSNLGFGIMLYNSSGNVIFKNDFYRNYKNNAYDNGANQWNNVTIGNYYGDLKAPAGSCRYTEGNSVCNLGYPIPGGSSIDRRPAINPF